MQTKQKLRQCKQCYEEKKNTSNKTSYLYFYSILSLSLYFPLAFFPFFLFPSKTHTKKQKQYLWKHWPLFFSRHKKKQTKKKRKKKKKKTKKNKTHARTKIVNKKPKNKKQNKQTNNTITKNPKKKKIKTPITSNFFFFSFLFINFINTLSSFFTDCHCIIHIFIYNKGMYTFFFITTSTLIPFS